mgnify:CR=1 FL=1
MNQLEACPGLCGPRRPQHENAERGAVLRAVKIKIKKDILTDVFLVETTELESVTPCV